MERRVLELKGFCRLPDQWSAIVFVKVWNYSVGLRLNDARGVWFRTSSCCDSSQKMAEQDARSKTGRVRRMRWSCSEHPRFVMELMPKCTRFGTGEWFWLWRCSLAPERSLDLVQIQGDARRNSDRIGDLFEYFEETTRGTAQLSVALLHMYTTTLWMYPSQPRIWTP
eukprot:3515751-Amphidinium_carterae.1